MTIGAALISFGVIAGLLTLVPGIDTALVIRSVLNRGRGYAFASSAGIVTGAMIWGLAASVGASALLVASETAYRALTFAGAAYMVYLGLSLIVRTVVPASSSGHVVRLTGSRRRAYLTGVGTNLLNPKVGVFYLASIPQFIPAHVAPVLMGALLAGMHCALTLLWFSLLILGGAVLSRFLRSERAQHIVDRVTGTVLVGFGIRLALQPH